ALIQPSMIYISSKCEKHSLDAWELFPCPVCGQNPSIVIKPETDVWRFKCSFCLTEYKTDIFTCPICNTQDIDNKDFFIIEPNQVYEIASCKKCNHYFKIINKDKIYSGLEIPEGLEDLYTYFLDEIASEHNLVRIDEK
ncbi:formate dehydrogenase accessory protein FdhE, partial [Thermoproteota archaeon]